MGGGTPQVSPPVPAIVGGKIAFHCPTDGASIVYRIKSGDEPYSSWRLYNHSIAVSEGTVVEAIGCRIGYRDSDLVQQVVSK